MFTLEYCFEAGMSHMKKKGGSIKIQIFLKLDQNIS